MACKGSRPLHSSTGTTNVAVTGAESPESPPPLPSPSLSLAGPRLTLWLSWMEFHRGVWRPRLLSPWDWENICFRGHTGGGVPPPGLHGGAEDRKAQQSLVRCLTRSQRGWHRCLGTRAGSHSLGSLYSDTGHHPVENSQSCGPIYRAERGGSGRIAQGEPARADFHLEPWPQSWEPRLGTAFSSFQQSRAGEVGVDPWSSSCSRGKGCLQRTPVEELVLGRAVRGGRPSSATYPRAQ